MEVAKASTTVDGAEVAVDDVVADGENDSATETNIMRMDNDFIIIMVVVDVVRSFTHTRLHPLVYCRLTYVRTFESRKTIRTSLPPASLPYEYILLPLLISYYHEAFRFGPLGCRGHHHHRIHHHRGSIHLAL